MKFYTVISGNCSAQLSLRVRQYIERGYVPIGSLTISKDGYFYQAMVNEEMWVAMNNTNKETK